jgi:DNA polymerase-3 subunit delta
VTLEELRQALAAAPPRPAYLLLGAEPLLRDDALAAIRDAALEGASADFDLERLEGSAATPGSLLDSVRTLPVLAPRRVVVLLEPDATRRRALGDALAEIVPALPERAVLVVVASRADARTRWVKAFASDAVVDCNPPRAGRALVTFIRAEAGRQGAALEAGAAELLAERVGPQLLLLRREIEKARLLAGPDEPVTRSAVLAGTSDVAEQPIWDLTDAIGEGRSADALRVLARVLAGGAPAPVVLGSLASHFRRLLRVCTGGRVAGPPFVVRKLEGQGRRYSPPRLLACLRAIHRTDLVLKGEGGLPPALALERLVMALAG